MNKAPDDAIEPLFERICELMEKEQLFLKTRLKLSDIAALLGVNSRYVSESINTHRGCTFSTFVNSYRIDFVKIQLTNSPHKKIAAIALESGFDNEISFYRTFKNFTNMTPREWLQATSQ